MQLLQEQYLTVQNYVCSLFDSLPKIDLPSQDLSEPQVLLQKCIQQNTQYGRKIIQLSEKFTAKYRKDHFVERREIQSKILQIYKLLSSSAALSQEETTKNMDQMVDFILKQVVKFQKNKEREDFIRDSKVGEIKLNSSNSENREFQTFASNQKVSISRLIQNGSHSIQQSGTKKRSQASKSKVQKKQQQITTKKALQIKGFFDQCQEELRAIYQKIRKISDIYKIGISEEKTKFTKKSHESDSENVIKMIKAQTNNQTENMRQIQQLILSIAEGFERKIKKEGLAESRLNLYRQQISKRQDVYSYTVSKMLQQIKTLKSSLQKQKIEDGKRIASNLEDLGQKFYQLYPSESILRDLKTQPLRLKGSKQYGTQTTILKASRQSNQNQSSDFRKNQIQYYRLAIKMNEFIDHFQKSIKYKKQIEYKQVERLLQSFRQLVPRKAQSSSSNLNMSFNGNSINGSGVSSVPNQLNSFQQEIRKIMQISEKHEKDIEGDYQKKNKKLQKKVTQLQKGLQETLVDMNNFRQQKQQEKRKIQKKLEIQKDQTRKVRSQKQKLQKSLEQLIEESNRLKKLIKIDQQKMEEQRKKNKVQLDQMSEQLQITRLKMQRLQKQTEQQKEKIVQQRRIYKQKIVMMETREQESQIDTIQLKQRYENMIAENQTLKGRLSECTELYETKIRQVQQMITDIRNLQIQLKARSIRIQQLEDQNRLKKEIIKNHQQELQKVLIINQQLKQDAENCRKQYYRFKEMEILNDQDINTLRQQIDKVKSAYLESEQHVESMKAYCSQVQAEHDRLKRQKSRANSGIKQLQSQLEGNIAIKQKIEKDLMECRSQLSIKERQFYEKARQAQQYKRQNLKVRKDITEVKEQLARLQNQNRELRQQLQKKKEQEGLQNGKKKLQMQAMKVQLRRKTEQLQKQKQKHLQQIQTLQQKNSQLQQLITQKQLLMKIANNHLTS